MDDEEFIEGERRARREHVRFFSNAAKPERERWVVREFLSNLSISVSEDNLISPKRNDDVDIIFCDANFQVKELTDRVCRRSSEVREDLKRAEAATRAEDLLDTPTGGDIVWVEAHPRIRDQASNNQYPPRSRREIDLLFYITRRHAYADPSLQLDDLSALGWRSISCLIGKHSYVLVAASHAPSFLRDRYSGS